MNFETNNVVWTEVTPKDTKSTINCGSLVICMYITQRDSMYIADFHVVDQNDDEVIAQANVGIFTSKEKAKQELMKMLNIVKFSINTDVEIDNNTFFGLKIYNYNYRGKSVKCAVGTDNEATEAAKKMVLDILWGFETDIIVKNVPFEVNSEFIASLKKMQKTMNEDCNEIIKSLLGKNLNEFVEGVIKSYGRGHFLAFYDYEERISDDFEKEFPKMPKGLFVYILNVN